MDYFGKVADFSEGRHAPQGKNSLFDLYLCESLKMTGVLRVPKVKLRMLV